MKQLKLLHQLIFLPFLLAFTSGSPFVSFSRRTVFPDGYPIETLRSCTPTQRWQIWNAVLDMYTMVRAVINRWDPSDPAFKAFFGTQAQSSSSSGGVGDADILLRFNKLNNYFGAPQNKVFSFDCNFINNNVCNKGNDPMAGLDKPGGSTIYLCASWWRQFEFGDPYIVNLTAPTQEWVPNTVMDSYFTHGAVLVHEMMHAVFEALDVDEAGGVKAPQVFYGQKQTMKLARIDPGAARNNAENYAFYAMSRYWYKGRFSANPDNLVGANSDELKRI